MCLLGKGICSLGSVLRENSKLTHVLLQASPLSFSVAVIDECHVCSCLPAPTSPAGPLNMCLISGPLQWELWVFAFLLCIPHMPALSIFVVIRMDASHCLGFFIFHCHGILTVPKGRQVECGSHCQMILIYKGIKKTRVQISRGRICSDVLNLVWGVKICLESQSMNCKCDSIYLDRYVCLHTHTHIWMVIFTILVWRFLYLYSSVFLNRC